MDLDDMIEFDEEGTNLDFKKEEYQKSNYVNLIKDVMSMANALNDGPKRIVIGVKHKPGEEKDFIGIEKLSDQANFENVIQENIEPNINFSYYPYSFKNITLGILEIDNNNDRPYMMKKDYGGTLKKGDAWIRKGSRQSRVIREDIDKMFQDKRENVLNKKIRVGFGNQLSKKTNLKKSDIKNENYPSSIRRKELETLLGRLELKFYKSNISVSSIILQEAQILNSFGLNGFGAFHNSDKSIRVGYDQYGLPIYKQREQLQSEIDKIDEDYREYDNYYKYEENSQRFNCQIYNDGDQFLEDVKIEMFFDATIFEVATKIYHEPEENIIPTLSHWITSIDEYPDVVRQKNMYVISTYHNKIRHKTLVDFFSEDLRILVKPDVNDEEVEISYRISAKNISDLLEGKLKVKII